MSNKLVDEDDYWNTSETKGFDFDVDKTTYGTASAKKGDHLFADDNVSEISYELPTNEIPLHLIISDSDLRMILEEQSMLDYPVPKNILPEDEVRILRRQLVEKTHAPSPTTTINRIILGKPCSLENYRSIHEKEELLDEAIKSGSGDAILCVVLHLAKTLKKVNLNRILLYRQIAVNHYINYLALRLEVNEITDLLTMLGKYQEAAMIQFQITCQSTSNVDTKKKKLKQIYSNFFTQPPNSNTFYSQMVGNYINLLEWQTSHAVADLIDSSPLKTLYYLCGTHKWSDASSSNTSTPIKKDNSKTTLNLSPLQFIDLYHISQSQFEWIALNERANSHAWLDIEQLFEKKSWKSLKSKTFQIAIPLERAILQLYSLSAPPAVLNKFLAHLDDLQRRLALSRRVNAVRSEIDTLVLMKDKIELESLRARLTTGTEEYFYFENALKNINNSKWKTDGINKLIKN